MLSLDCGLCSRNVKSPFRMGGGWKTSPGDCGIASLPRLRLKPVVSRDTRQPLQHALRLIGRRIRDGLRLPLPNSPVPLSIRAVVSRLPPPTLLHRLLGNHMLCLVQERQESSFPFWVSLHQVLMGIEIRWRPHLIPSHRRIHSSQIPRRWRQQQRWRRRAQHSQGVSSPIASVASSSRCCRIIYTYPNHAGQPCLHQCYIRNHLSPQHCRILHEHRMSNQ